jgi:putative addiction module component (TIGR02574 family)
MARTSTALLDDALRLSEEEREHLGWALLDSVHGGRDEGDVDAAWAEEIRRRLDDLREGRTSSRPWAEVETEIRAKQRPR